MKAETVKRWNYAGHECLLRKVSGAFPQKSILQFGDNIPREWFCGYVEISKEEEEVSILKASTPQIANAVPIIDIDCHGGITFCQEISFDALPPKFYIGFDCAHYGDSIEKQDEKFCIAECERIIAQVIAIKEVWRET